MSDAKHTPGPWSYSITAGNYGRIYFHGLGRADRSLGADSLFGYCGEANARLIAAAPDGLARAKANVAAFEAIDKMTPFGDTEPKWWLAWSEQVRLDREFIAKAEFRA